MSKNEEKWYTDNRIRLKKSTERCARRRIRRTEKCKLKHEVDGRLSERLNEPVC